MESPDVVDTSDVDELEVLSLSEDFDHPSTSDLTPLKSLSARFLASPPGPIIERARQQRPGSLTAFTTCHDRSSDCEADNPSPRKRIKITHGADKVSRNMTAESSLPRSEHPEVAPLEEILGSPSKYMLAGEDSVSSTTHEASEALDYGSLFSSPCRSQDSELQLTSQPFPHSPPLPVSAEPYSLFSSPCCPTSPPKTSSQRSHDQSISARQKHHSLLSSPLTPTSLAPLSQGPIRSPDPSHLSPPRHPQTPPLLVSRPTPSAISRPDRSPVEIPEDPGPPGRYSLRRREARQLNPYAYDKLMYKQQLKFHPDAIVKFRSPHRSAGSRETGLDGIQDDFVFPLDNPDEDGDYVDAEAEGSKRRNKARSLDRDDVSGVDNLEPDAEQMVGWLPEILKELSSNDEDDNKFRKLAKRIRRERKKAEAKARNDARTAEVASQKSTKWKHRPFPVREDVDGGAAHASRRSSATELFSPANSGPMMSSRPTSPARSATKCPTPSRASSHFPVPSPVPPGSPDFSAYLQDDPLFNFNDYEEPLPQNDSPINPSGTHSAPSSPSGPSATPAVSAWTSNASGTESVSDQSLVKMSSKDRKRLRALKRMMPASMIAQQLGVSNASRSQPPRTRAPVVSSGSEAEEVPAIAGIARVRKGWYSDVEIRGDPESSDVEPPVASDNEAKGNANPGVPRFLSDGQSGTTVRRRRHASPRSRHEVEVISLSDGSAPESSLEDSGSSSSDEEQARQSLFDRSARGPARETSLIDWMLSRARSSDGPKSKPKQPAARRKPRGSRLPRLNIITSGARRYGEHRQTRLPFVRANASSNAMPSIRHGSEHRDQAVHFDQDPIEERKKRKKKRRRQTGTNQEALYNIYHEATRITSKHREGKGGRGTALVIEHNDNDFRQALDPAWRAEVERWNRPVSLARHSATNMPQSAPTAPRPRLCRRTSPQLTDEVPLPLYFQRKEESIRHRIVIDMNIIPLPFGVKFAPSSYVGKGHLYQLVAVTSGNSEAPQPVSCDIQGLEIGPATSAAEFSALFGPLCDRLLGALREFTIGDVDTMKEWESATIISNRFLSWLAVRAEDEEFAALEETLREYVDGLLIVLDALEANIFTLSAYWFAIELSARLATGVKYRRGVETGQLVQSAKHLILRLLPIDLQPAFATIRAAADDIDDTLLSNRAAEMWVCLMHLLPSFKVGPQGVPGHPLWRLLAELYPESSPTGAEASEDIWHTIFNLCAISQFSVHGLSTSTFQLPAAWELVAIALKKITLTIDPETERQLPQRALEKRDDYVSFVVSRCFLLWNRWGWRLDDGIVMFKSLQEIFRSRNFANLLHEHSATMGFFENGDLELLSKRDPHDTVFELFLKMVVQAVHLLSANAELDPKQRSVNIKKLLQMAVPVSPVPFSRSAPPSKHSLSMLVNRFSAMAVAIHLDPTAANVKFRVNQARRCVSFGDGDDQSRVACVYGTMNFAMIVRHHKIPGGLEQALEWLKEVADVLMDEYKEDETGARKGMTTMLIQLLLGSVRRVIETSSLDKGQNHAEYPDPALLDGPWVTRVFNPRTDLVTIQQTGVEIRMLVQSFLDARRKALPEVQAPVVHSAESQESQDEYDGVDWDFNDIELLAALGEVAEVSVVTDLKAKEDALCKVLDRSITPAVYRLVCKYFGDNEHAKNGTTSDKAADEWIDCWVGCANVLVQNNHKDWGLYRKLGQQSWEKIIDDGWRRRVELRFNLTLLRLDPTAYNKTKNEFIAVLLVATLSFKLTIEHEFVNVVLSLDGLQHPLLRGAPVERVPGTTRYEIGLADYDTVREGLIETIFSNVAGCLRTRVDAESQTYVELLVTMLTTMRSIYQELGEEKAEYGAFYERVLDKVSGHPELSTHPRLAGYVR